MKISTEILRRTLGFILDDLFSDLVENYVTVVHRTVLNVFHAEVFYSSQTEAVFSPTLYSGGS